MFSSLCLSLFMVGALLGDYLVVLGCYLCEAQYLVTVW